VQHFISTPTESENVPPQAVIVRDVLAQKAIAAKENSAWFESF
jgi:hypothetical protein